MNLDKVLYVEKEIGDLHLVWLQASNLYFQLEEPAWFVFKRIANQIEMEAVSEEFANRYDVGKEESSRFVIDMHNRIHEMNQPIGRTEGADKDANDASQQVFTPYSVYFYQVGDLLIKFLYETEWLEEYIHPLIDHLSVEGNQEAELVLFELFTINERVVFRLDGDIKGIWDEERSNYTKGKIFMELINLLHQKADDNWLMTVHASAITNKKKTILFSAPPGSGKTTIGALLQAEGFQVISDDFVPFDKDSFNAFPFPTAMSVKEGAVEVLNSLYHGLKDLPVNYISREKQVRYLPIENDKLDLIFPV
ncbi:MAG TPA: hypothetical protein VKA27_04680, partial [Sunxiuqinia sp.]|nr:hypothetical protein [Sunxiuqinia sp.]